VSSQLETFGNTETLCITEVRNIAAIDSQTVCFTGRFVKCVGDADARTERHWHRAKAYARINDWSSSALCSCCAARMRSRAKVQEPPFMPLNIVDNLDNTFTLGLDVSFIHRQFCVCTFVA
jgi:hypothetical protein